MSTGTQVTAQSVEALGISAADATIQAIGGGLFGQLIAAFLKRLLESGQLQKFIEELLKKLLPTP